MVILVILKSLCVFWFCRVAISPLLYSVSFNSKASWSFGPILLKIAMEYGPPLEYLGSTTWGGDHAYISSRGCSMNDFAMIFTVWILWMPFH